MITVKEARELNGVEDWELSPSQEKFLVDSTEEILKKHDRKWFEENLNCNRRQLEIIFNGFLA